jgi:BNR/Asp-box repeat
MRRPPWWRIAALVTAVVGALFAVSGAAGSVTGPFLASGPSQFTGCTADDPTTQLLFSTLYPNAEPEPRAAINPTNPQNIVGVFQQDRWNNGGDRGLSVSVSHNGGASWTPMPIPGITKCSNGAFDRASDPWVTFAPNGDAYAISLSFDVFDSNNAILVSKSTNGGDSWSNPIAVAADNTDGLDKESITADPHDSNFVYAMWDRFVSPPGFPPSNQGRFHAHSFVQQAWFSRTTNGGASWETPHVAFNPGTQAGTIGSIVNVLPDGTLVDGLVVFSVHKQSSTDLRGTSVAVIRSTDRGETWSKKPIIIAPFDPTFFGATDPDTGHPIRSGGLPDFAVDSANGNLYAVWEDDHPTSGVDAIQFSQSTDGGLTWSTPIKINQTPTNIPSGDQQAFTPTVKVSANGTVGVTYYDFRNNTGAPGLTTDYWFVSCASDCSHASSWGGEQHVAGPFDEEQAADAGGFFLGDYEGMVTNGNTFGPFFVQAVSRAANNPSDVFYATVTP